MLCFSSMRQHSCATISTVTGGLEELVLVAFLRSQSLPVQDHPQHRPVYGLVLEGKPLFVLGIPVGAVLDIRTLRLLPLLLSSQSTIRVACYHQDG